MEEVRAPGTGILMDADEMRFESLRLAELGGSLAWALRAAHDLATLLRDRGEARDARNVLAPVYRRFSDDFETRDLRHARELLASFT